MQLLRYTPMYCNQYLLIAQSSIATHQIYQYTAAVIIIAVIVGLMLFDPDEDEPTRYEPNQLPKTVIQMMDDWTFLNFTEDNVTDDALVLCGRFRLYHDYGLILTANREDNNIYIKNISEHTDDGCNATSISIYVDISGHCTLPFFYQYLCSPLLNFNHPRLCNN